MTYKLPTLGLAAAMLAGLAGGAVAATTDTVPTPSGTVTTHSPSATMSSNGSTSANGTPYVTSDGRVGPAAPSAGGKVGGGNDSGGNGSGGNGAAH